MAIRVLCPKHEERTPSCIVYHDGYKCMGCGAWGSLSDLGMTPEQAPPQEEAEDLNPVFEYITSLPLKEVRGILFPADARSYFVVWPNLDYYKRRFYDPGTGPKYVGARGHKKPAFWAQDAGSRTLVLCEGEINALSIAKACPELDVVSPGGCGDFTAKRLKVTLPDIIQYDTVLVVADRDEPGAKAVMEALGWLQAQGKATKWMLMAPDANDILARDGCELLRKQIFTGLGQEVA